MNDPAPLPRMPTRDPKGHKGTFGTVLVIGGCASGGKRMIGAPSLAATAALRSGCGLVRLLTPAPIIDAALTICPSATGVPMDVDGTGELIASDAAAVIDDQLNGASAIIVGPGMGGGEAMKAIVLRCVQQEDVPVIVDADAINALSETPELWRDFKAAAVLTPHPGEYNRLAESLRIEANPVIDAERPRAAELLAQRLGCIVALKGAGTVVSDGQRTWVNATGGAMLATAGTGDVLAGVIGGLAAQFVRLGRRGALDLFDATRIAVLAHGLAGERWSKQNRAEAGLLAMELTEFLPAILQDLER